MATWVPAKDRDTTYYIFKRLFKCRVPYIQSRSPDDIRRFGMPMSGDARYDQETANESVVRMLPISAMASYFAKGVQVSVVNRTDCEEIYKRVTDHLIAWRDYTERSMNPNKAPLEDLLLLDEFARAIYPFAKSFFNEDVDSSLKRAISGIDSLTRDNILSRPKQTVIEIAPAGTRIADTAPRYDDVPEDNGPQYPSMGETFQRRLEERQMKLSGGSFRDGGTNGY